MTKQTKNNPYEEIQNAFDDAHSRKLNKWIVGQHTSDQGNFDTYVNKLIDARGPAPSPGGGSTSNIQIDTINSPLSTIEGKYAVNLFDYTHIAKSPKIGITGITSANDKHQRGFHTMGKQVLPSNSNHYVGHPLGFAGIKKNKQITLDWHWYKTPPSDSRGRIETGKFDINIIETENPTSGSNVDITTDIITGSKKHSPTKYGFYKLGLGTVNQQKPDNYGLHIQAYYGDFKPQGIRREFQFQRYNNIELMSNGTEKDVYTRGKLYDTLTKKLNCVNIKDLKIHRGNPEHDVLGHPHYIAIELPEDCDIPEKQHELQQGKELGKKCITNNLPEIQYEDEQFHPHEDRPHFVQYISEVLVENTEHKLVSKWCWIIMIDIDKIDYWESVLKETQIIYPIEEKSQEPIHLPLGGQLYTLTNNRTIMTCLYKTVAEDPARGTVTFSASPFGANDVTIQKSEIVSIEQI